MCSRLCDLTLIISNFNVNPRSCLHFIQMHNVALGVTCYLKSQLLKCLYRGFGIQGRFAEVHASSRVEPQEPAGILV